MLLGARSHQRCKTPSRGPDRGWPTEMPRQPGFYERRIFPWLNDKLTASPDLIRLRAETLVGARGHVLEIGFGTGANLDHYPAAVDAITAVEPNDGMNARAAALKRSS